MIATTNNNLNNELFRISPFPPRSTMFSRRLNKSIDGPYISSPSSSLTSTPSSTPTLMRRSRIELLTSNNSSATVFLELMSRAREGLQYYSPELCTEGVNGTYFLRDKNGKKIAVFKPQDEEGVSENNPKRKLNDKNKGNATTATASSSKSTSTSTATNLPNKGILPGEAALREVAAYLLDSEHIYGVPKTQIVKITHNFNHENNQEESNSNSNVNGNQSFTTKIGSLQEFIDNDGCSEDFGCKSFPIKEVHKIGILDLQILNVDRHAGNILIKKSRNANSNTSTFTLVPIDQGFSLPDTLECAWFEWMNWPQSKIPFDDSMKSYISRLDIERDAHMLQTELGIRNECIQTMRIMYTLLKKSIDLNLTLYDIGMIVCKKNYDLAAPSVLEQMVMKAKDIVSVPVTVAAEATHALTTATTITPTTPTLVLVSTPTSIKNKNNNNSNNNNNAKENNTINPNTASFYDVLSQIIEQDTKNTNINPKKRI